MDPVIQCGEAGDQFVPAKRGWRVVLTDERAKLLIFPVIFWHFTSIGSRGKRIAPAIKPMACVNCNPKVVTEIEDVTVYETYLGVLGPDEDDTRYHELAVGTAEAVYGTSALELLAETGEQTE